VWMWGGGGGGGEGGGGFQSHIRPRISVKFHVICEM